MKRYIGDGAYVDFDGWNLILLSRTPGTDTFTRANIVGLGPAWAVLTINTNTLKISGNTAEDGIRATNTIYLEPEVWRRLVEYVESLKDRTNEPQP